MSRPNGALTEAAWVRRLLIGIALGFFALFLLLPLVVVFAEALTKGIAPYFTAIVEPDAIAALKLSLAIVAIVVPINALCGLCAAWAIAQFRFLKRLMLVHGRTDYRRTCKVVLYSFYKNIVLTLVLFAFTTAATRLSPSKASPAAATATAPMAAPTTPSASAPSGRGPGLHQQGNGQRCLRHRSRPSRP